MFNIKETADNLKTKATKVNKEVYKASEGIVDETIAAGKEWNKILTRTLKTGTYIFAQQQDLALTALEEAKKQVSTGNKRFRKLMGFKTAEKMFNDVKEDIVDAVEDFKQDAEKTVSKAKKVVASTATKAKKEAAKPAKAKKVLATTAKKVATKPAAAKKVLATTKKVVAATAANDLKVINGIGPKMEKVLNAAGITTYAELAAFNAEELKKILLAENARYAMYEPKEWIAEAQNMMK